MEWDGLFRIAFWVLLFLVMVMRVYFIIQVRRAGERILPDQAAIQREGTGMFLIRFFSFFALLALLVSYALDLPWIQNLNFSLAAWLRGCGFLLGLASLGFWTWSQAALGALWSAQLLLRSAHFLVTTGPYSRMRHPMYTAMVGWGTSLALLTTNWIFVMIAAAMALIFFTRVPREEQMLLDQFGDEYRAYMRRTGMFLPKYLIVPSC